MATTLSECIQNVTTAENDPGFTILLVHQSQGENDDWNTVFLNSAIVLEHPQSFTFEGDESAKSKLWIYNSFAPDAQVVDNDGNGSFLLLYH